jgi:uncharacterized protein (DUF2062 family)
MISLVRRKIGERLLELLGRSEPAEELAASFAVGVAVSFSPFIGLHWIIALAIAWFFRLNKVDVLLATFALVNPWTTLPVFTSSTVVGWWILHSDRPTSDLFRLDWGHFTLTSLRSNGIRPFQPYLGSFFLGSILFSVVAGLVTYVLVLRLVNHHRRRKAEKLRAVERRHPPDPETAREDLHEH